MYSSINSIVAYICYDENEQIMITANLGTNKQKNISLYFEEDNISKTEPDYVIDDLDKLSYKTIPVQLSF